jgi:hypothetical protein
VRRCSAAFNSWWARRGKTRLFELEPQPLEAVRNYLDLVSKPWDTALARLKKFVEAWTWE